MLSIEEALLQEKKCIFPIKGTSMLPMLQKEKDTVLIVPATEELSLYDLALYKVGKKYILHRVIGIKKDFYIICGDNCIKKEKVKKNKVFGKALGFYKNGKYVPCDNEEYLKYAKKRTKNRWRRSLLLQLKYVSRKIFGKKVEQ